MKQYYITTAKPKQFRPGYVEYALYPFSEDISREEARVISRVLCSLHASNEKSITAVLFIDHVIKNGFIRTLNKDHRGLWSLEHKRKGIHIFRASLHEELLTEFIYFVWRLLAGTELYFPISFSRLEEQEKKFLVDFCVKKMTHRFPLSLILDRVLFDQFFPIVATWGDDGDELIVGCEFCVRRKVLECIQHALERQGIAFSCRTEGGFMVSED